MSAFPERGYGSWRQWHRRRKKLAETRELGQSFYVDGGSGGQEVVDAWISRHEGVGPGTLHARVEAVRLIVEARA